MRLISNMLHSECLDPVPDRQSPQPIDVGFLKRLELVYQTTEEQVSVLVKHSIETYLVAMRSCFSRRFNSPNRFSTGFSHGLYYALNSTFTPKARHVSSTLAYLCMTALSMNKIMSLCL